MICKGFKQLNLRPLSIYNCHPCGVHFLFEKHIPANFKVTPAFHCKFPDDRIGKAFRFNRVYFTQVSRVL